MNLNVADWNKRDLPKIANRIFKTKAKNAAPHMSAIH